eukprot:jgi/Mesen1/10296/ME000079S09720
MATTALAKSPSLLRPLGRFSELDRKVVSEVASTSRSVYVKPGCCSVRHARKETLNLCSLQPMPNNVVGRLHSQCPSEAGYTSVSSNTLFDNLGGKLESSGKRRRSSRRRTSQKLRAVAAEAAVASPPVTTEYADEEDFVKAGGSDLEYVKLQAMKGMDQPNIADKLKALASGEDILDMVIIGCGPAGLSLAAEAAKQGLQVGLIGPDGPFVNNYGVWVDEFKAIGLEHCIEQIYTDAAIYLESDVPILVGRAYGRVGRHLLRGELLSRCAEGGVSYLNTEVDSITDTHANGSTLVCADGSKIQCRLVVVAAGAASGKFLTYEEGSQGVGVQTAYGIEIEVEDYPYDPSIMHFMDYRDLEKDDADGEHFKDLPTFLYAMPITKKRVFFEETCLAARPAMPFSVLKERLQRRLAKLGLTYSVVHEEEWSYVPVGGTLPSTTQRHMGFGAAASMIHPATGEPPLVPLALAPFLRRPAARHTALRIFDPFEEQLYLRRLSLDSLSRPDCLAWVGAVGWAGLGCGYGWAKLGQRPGWANARGYSITRSLTEAPQFAAAIAAALGAGGRHRKEGGASAPPAAAALASQRDSHAVALQA